MVELHLSAASWFLGHYRIVYLLNTRPDLRSNRHLVTRSVMSDVARKLNIFNRSQTGKNCSLSLVIANVNYNDPIKITITYSSSVTIIGSTKLKELNNLHIKQLRYVSVPINLP